MFTSVEYVFKDKGMERISAIDAKLAALDAKFAKTERGLHKFNAAQAGSQGILGKFNGLLDEQSGAVSMLTSRFPALGSAVAALANPFTIAAGVVLALGAAFFHAGSEAQKWERLMGKINVTAQLSKDKLHELSDDIMHLEWFGNTPEKVQEGYNKIISGVGDAQRSLDILDVSLKGAKAGFADVDIAADALVNTLNSVKDSSPKEVMDVLFATLNKGKAEFRDIAQYLPKVIPYSNQLGLSFKETAAEFALLTAKGQSVEHTSVLLENAFRSLADSNKRKNIEKLVKVFDGGKMRPMVDIMADMDKKFAGLTDEQRIKKFGKLQLDAEAASAFTLLMQNIDDLKEFDNVVQDSSRGIGAMQQALNDSANGLDKWDTISEGISKSWIYLGANAVPVIDKIADKIIALFDWLAAVEEKTGIFGATFKLVGDIISLALDAISAPFKWIDDILSALTFKVGMFGEEGNEAAFSAKDGFTALLWVIRDIFGVLGDVMNMFGNLINLRFDAISENWDKLKDDVMNFGQQKIELKVGAPDAFAMSLLPQGAQQQALMSLGQNTQVPGGSKTTVTPALANASSDMSNIARSGNQERNIYINIQQLIGKIENKITNLQGVKDIGKAVTEAIVAAVHDAELSIS